MVSEPFLSVAFCGGEALPAARSWTIWSRVGKAGRPIASKVLMTFPWSASRRQICTEEFGATPFNVTVNVFAEPRFLGGAV